MANKNLNAISTWHPEYRNAVIEIDVLFTEHSPGRTLNY
jgi:hypothetical protein